MLSCKKEEFYEGGEVDLAFSVDTLRFDTVFTTLGSATRFVKVYNRHNKKLLLSSVSLASGQSTKFRINVDGVAVEGPSLNDIEIWPNDSIYIFVEVTIDPDAPLSESPFVIEEKLNVEANGTLKQINLEAWGQNANYIPNNMFQGKTALLSCDLNEVVWDDPKPYVIYGLLVIDSCTLIIPAGQRIYVHGGIANNDFGVYNDGIIWVFNKGNIISEGTVDQPVIIQGDRLETEFEGISGQWGGIRLGEGSKNNIFTHTIIRNPLVGIRIDSAANLTMTSSIIENSAGSSIIGVRANINLKNTLIYNSGGHGLQLVYGGTFNFDHVTVASYGNNAEAIQMANFICLNADCSDGAVYRTLANIRNSIFMGSMSDELSFLDATDGNDPFAFKATFKNCIVKVDELLDADNMPDFLNDCDGCLNATLDDPMFLDVDLGDYHLDSLSIAIGAALPLSNVKVDLDGNARDMDNPDIGCYERIE